MDKITTIRVKQSTKDRLSVYGNKGDSYDDIISNMLDGMDNSNNWKAFTNMTGEMQKEVLKKLHEFNNDFMFSVDSDKAYVGLQYAYLTEESVRRSMNKIMKDLNYI